MLEIDGVPSGAIEAAWPEMRRFVLRALDEGAGHLGSEDVLAALRRREMQLWALRSERRLVGALVTEIVRWPRRTVCRLVLAAADDGWREEWLRCRDRIEAWARSEGCDGMEIYGRPGWARLVPDARRRAVLEWNLDEKETTR